MIIETVFIMTLWGAHEQYRKSEHATLVECTAAIGAYAAERQEETTRNRYDSTTKLLSCVEATRVVTVSGKPPEKPRPDPAPRREWKGFAEWWRNN